MSHIPSNAMPHAGGDPEHRRPDGLGNEEHDKGNGSAVGRLKEAARDNPKTAIAAGVAVAAGVAAAVAVPIARAARRRSGEEGTEGGGKRGKKKKD